MRRTEAGSRTANSGGSAVRRLGLGAGSSGRRAAPRRPGFGAAADGEDGCGPGRCEAVVRCECGSTRRPGLGAAVDAWPAEVWGGAMGLPRAGKGVGDEFV